MRDVCAIVTERGAGCDGRCGVRWQHDPGKVGTGFPTRIMLKQSHRAKRAQRTAKSCGPGAATLALPAGACSRTTGARKAASPGRARISRKTIARGKPGCLGCTCQNRVHSFAFFRTRRCGRSRRPAFPAPSIRGGPTRLQSSGDNQAAGMKTNVSSSLRGAKRRSNPPVHLPRYGLLRFARNDVSGCLKSRIRKITVVPAKAGIHNHRRQW
jgi:hypothetical protein